MSLYPSNLVYISGNHTEAEENFRFGNSTNVISANQSNVMPFMMTNNFPNNNDMLSILHLYRIAANYPSINRLTLPVDGGDLYGPFILPEEQIVHEIEFNLSEDSLKQINLREDLDIVLLSRFNKENSLKFLTWPSSLKISVNDNPLSLDNTTFNKIPLHSPQFIKRYCNPGRNVLKFELYDIPSCDITMFLFNIYMVHRPTILYSRKLIQENAQMGDELTMKILQSNCTSLGKDSVNISALCPISNKRIEIPIRFRNCHHLQPFDLMSFLKFEARWMFSICPLCHKSVYFNLDGYHQQTMVIDVMLQRMLEKVPLSFDMINVDSYGNFSPFCTNPEYLAPMIHQQRVPFQDMIDCSPHSRASMYLYQCDPSAFQGPQNDGPMKWYADTYPLDSSRIQKCFASVKKTIHKPKKPSIKKNKTSLLPSSSVIVATSRNTVSCPITSPNTRTSSIASTNSPDSVNVPGSILKGSSSGLDHQHFLVSPHFTDELLISHTNLHPPPMNIFCDSHFTSSIMDPVSTFSSLSLPQISSLSSSTLISFSQPSSTFLNPCFSPDSLNNIPSCTDGADSRHMLSRRFQSPSILTPHSSRNNSPSISKPCILCRDPPPSCLSKYVDDILTNHEPVPELEDCDWLQGFDPVVNHQPISDLSDMDDF